MSRSLRKDIAALDDAQPAPPAMPPGNVKAGWTTTEAIATLVITIIGLAVNFGLINPADAQGLEDSITRIVAAAGVVVANAWVIVRYIQGRVQEKTIAQAAQIPALQAELAKPAAAEVAVVVQKVPPQE